MEKQEKQMKLFDIPFKLKNKYRKPLFYVEIINEQSCEIFTFWKRAWSKSQGKKLAAFEYNDSQGFCREALVKFGKVKEMKETKWRGKNVGKQTSKQVNKIQKKKEGGDKMEKQIKLYSVLDHDTEPIREKTRKKISIEERKKQGDFIANKSEAQVKKILESLRKKTQD